MTGVRQQGRTIFLVDGFNLYASLCLASEGLAAAGQPSGTKWLNLHSLCTSFLPLVRSPLQPQAVLTRIDYFTALAPWSQEKRLRHQWYIECLRASSVNVRMGRFKHKEVECQARCRQFFWTYEEKETDVAIGVALLAMFHEDLCDKAVLLSGDSDYVPALREAKRLFPSKRIYCVFPYGRASEHLKREAHGSFSIARESYVKHQLPDPFVLTPTRSIEKPADW